MRRYLLVDDNQAFIENLAEILTDEGAEVALAPTGERALELAGSQRFDALVTDMRMPVMTGARLAHEIRRVDPGLPVVVVTAYTGENDLYAAREEGLLAVLPKPVPIARLCELLKRARRDALVALIEDDEALADNLSEALRDRGFSAVTARSVTETERLGGVRPFVALADLRLPGGNDGAALECVRAKFPGMPAILVTAYAHGKWKDYNLRVFEKPFDTAQLLEEVEVVYQRSLP
ncbi:MAG: response regulator [Deltaproteobacteria bacterium]|nr:response regulator [Deltaproteobacteria bacterium]